VHIRSTVAIGFRVLAVCLLFGVCMAVGTALSGLDRAAERGLPTQPDIQGSPRTPPPAQPEPGSLFVPFLVFSVCVGSVASYLILRSSWHGWTLAGAMFVGMYGISTVVSQIESIFFLSGKLPPGLITALFVQGAIATALFAPLAVLVLGKWRAAMPGAAPAALEHLRAAATAWKLVLLIVAFVFLYMLFGYYVAWQNPELRKYYGGPEYFSFFGSLKGNWLNARSIYLVAAFRGLLHVAFMFPLVRMLRVTRWESATVTALFLSAWTTVLWLPNPLMPASVARSHFWETLGFNLVFGTLLGWFLNTSPADRS
jgi:hypothetical protein